MAIAPNGVSFQPAKFEIKEARKYNHDADGLTGNEAPASKEAKKDKKKKKLIEEVDEDPKSKKAKVNKLESIKPIQEVVKDAVEEEMEVSDEEAESSDIDMDEIQNRKRKLMIALNSLLTARKSPMVLRKTRTETTSQKLYQRSPTTHLIRHRLQPNKRSTGSQRLKATPRWLRRLGRRSAMLDA